MAESSFCFSESAVDRACVAIKGIPELMAGVPLMAPIRDWARAILAAAVRDDRVELIREYLAMMPDNEHLAHECGMPDGAYELAAQIREALK